MATVRKRTWQTRGGPKRAWIADYFDQDGVRRQKTFSTRGAAKEWLPATEQAVKERRHVPESKAPNVAAAAAAWIKRGEVGGRARSTLVQRRQHVDCHILPLLGAETKLTRIDVESFRDELLSSRSRAMAKKVMKSLKAILKQHKMGYLAADVEPIETGGRHKTPLKVGVDIPTKEEVNALLEVDDPKGLALVCLGAFAGLRASEFRGLAWPHLNLGDKAEVTIEERADKWGTIGSLKSEAAYRKIRLGSTTVKVLKAWKLAQPPIITKDKDGNEIRRPRRLVFGTSTDRPDMLANLQHRTLDPLQVRAGVTSGVKVDTAGKPVLDKDGNQIPLAKYGAHAFRHFAISAWLKTCCGDFKAVQKRAGHATLALTLDTYGHLLDANDADLAAAAERLVLG
jgi:integrase